MIGRSSPYLYRWRISAVVFLRDIFIDQFRGPGTAVGLMCVCVCVSEQQKF